MFTLGTRLVRGRVAWGEALANPMVVATVAAPCWARPASRSRRWSSPALRMLADLSIPLMLISLGVRMRDLKPADWRLPLAGAIVCPLSGLAVAPLAIALLPLASAEQAALWVFAALPPAVLNFLLAERYQRASQQVASIVLVGNLASLLVVPPVLAFALAR
jgi:predicted permease